MTDTIKISRELLERIAEPYLGRSTKQHMLALQELRAALAAPAAVQGDADNYRWLREQHNNVNSDIGVYDGANILATQEGELDLDAAIAAARQEGA